MQSENGAGKFFSSGLAEQEGVVAYFSMEIAVAPEMPTYSGGLGVLAGDTLRAGADLGLPMVAVTLLQRQGYFRQMLDASGGQTEADQPWPVEQMLLPEEPVIEVVSEGRTVRVRAWRYDLEGVSGHIIPIYFLDTDVEQNDPRDRELSGHLYGGDGDYRLRQETILGIGGARMLQALGRYARVYHMNEGHAALLTVALMERELDGNLSAPVEERDLEAVRRQCVFTTHTPVPAGHDRFSPEQAERVLGPEIARLLGRMGGYYEGLLNMTYVALSCSRFVNAVAMQHGKISREMFPEHPIDAITNGVHAATWTAPPMQAAFDRHFPRWRNDNLQLRYAIDIAPEEIEAAHAEAKRNLFQTVRERTGIELHPEVFTIGFARRVATYKRADLLFQNPERLIAIARQFGGLQILYSGKAHPHDVPGKNLIRRIFEAASHLPPDALRVIYLENYEWRLAAQLTAGTDLWLNTPQRPYEASGTSGMKAALNGVPSLSVLDGWWIEGCIEGVTGWPIADHDTPEEEAASLYGQLEGAILPLYRDRRDQWRRIMRSTIALNGPFFNTHRMLRQYIANAYYPDTQVGALAAELEPALAR